jgi:hypothetical protein
MLPLMIGGENTISLAGHSEHAIPSKLSASLDQSKELINNSF